MRRRVGWDWPLAISALGLFVVGLLSLYSEGRGKPGGGMLGKQLLNFAIGLIPFSLFLFADPRVWRRWTWRLYGLNLVLLVATRIVGETAGGAQRWLEVGPIQFQPSELAKLLTILTLSAFFADRWKAGDRPSTFLLSIGHVAVPAALILLQPHLGAALVVAAIWIAIALAGRVPLKTLAISAVAAACLVAGAFLVPGLMRDYQRSRVVGLLRGSQDEQGRGYQTSRAQIAFGVGGTTGVGFLNGTQKQGRFIPEQHTDFILTVIGEEGGLLGTTLVLGLFGAFFYRVSRIILLVKEPYHRLVAAGIYGMLLFHTTVNIGMLVGLVPVVGLWLPFLSYGGTALWLCMASVGLLLAIARRERPAEI